MLVYIVNNEHSPGPHAVFATKELAERWIEQQEDSVFYFIDVMTVRTQ